MTHIDSEEALMAAVDRDVFASTDGARYATAVYGVLDAAAASLRIVNAGHPAFAARDDCRGRQPDVAEPDHAHFRMGFAAHVRPACSCRARHRRRGVKIAVTMPPQPARTSTIRRAARPSPNGLCARAIAA